MWNFTWSASQKKPYRQLQICGLFGGKKDNSEKSDDTPSKVWDESLSYFGLLWSSLTLLKQIHFFFSVVIVPKLFTCYLTYFIICGNANVWLQLDISVTFPFAISFLDIDFLACCFWGVCSVFVNYNGFKCPQWEKSKGKNTGNVIWLSENVDKW